MVQGKFTIPTRVYLTAEQRETLFALSREHDIDLPDLISELLASFLEHLPTYDESDIDEDVTSDTDQIGQEIRQRRAEIRRLRARALTSGDGVPPWLTRYIADLENEIRRLEHELGR